MQASGTVALQNRDYRVDILVGGQEAMDAQLEQALSLIAAPEVEGYRVALNGVF